jgi:hypothetical protein
LIDWRVGLGRGDQVLIAAISGATPKIVIIRFRLYARTWRLISVRTKSGQLDASATDPIASSHDRGCQVRTGLAAGGRRIRTLGPFREGVRLAGGTGSAAQAKKVVPKALSRRQPHYKPQPEAYSGVAAGIFGIISIIIAADLMRGTGRFNLAQRLAALCVGIGAGLSNVRAGYIVRFFGYPARLPVARRDRLVRARIVFPFHAGDAAHDLSQDAPTSPDPAPSRT